jgi:hypothetical protein
LTTQRAVTTVPWRGLSGGLVDHRRRDAQSAVPQRPRVKAGTEALITFRVAERLAAVPGNEHLVPMVETMRRTLRTLEGGDRRHVPGTLAA